MTSKDALLLNPFPTQKVELSPIPLGKKRNCLAVVLPTVADLLTGLTELYHRNGISARGEANGAEGKHNSGEEPECSRCSRQVVSSILLESFPITRGYISPF